MADAVKPGNSVMQCVNLRPSADSDGDTVLTPVGLPPKIAENAGRPLLEYVHDDGSVSLFTASGSRLMCVRDGAALSEMHTYERTPDGSWGARTGCHDDILMSRAIALYVIMVRRLSPAASAA